jgi:hypothetical protein
MFISFTTDIWSRSAGAGSMMSLTAHYHYNSSGDGAKIWKPRVLAVTPFEGM